MDSKRMMKLSIVTTVLMLSMARSGQSTIRGGTNSGGETQPGIPVIQPLLITTTSPLPDVTLGSSYSVQFAAAGGVPPYSWSIVPTSLPPGLIFSSSGLLSGIPTTAGAYSLDITVTDSRPVSQEALFTLNVFGPPPPPPLQITTASPLPDASQNSPYLQSLSATGGVGSYTWSLLSGSLPAGLALSSSGVISGTPTTAGTSTFTVQVEDQQPVDASKQFTLTVTAAPPPPLQITTTSPLPPGVAGSSYAQSLNATGGTPPYSWSVTAGSPPAGTGLSTAGVLSGTPTTAAIYSFTARVTDAAAASASRDFQVTITSAGITPIEPQAFVNSHEADTALTAPDVTTNVAATCAAIQAAYDNWKNAPDRWEKIVVPANTLIDCGSTGLSFGPKIGATKFVAITSNNRYVPAAANATVCSGKGAKGTRNYKCATGADKAKLWHIRGGAAGSAKLLNFLSGANHILLDSMEAERDPAGTTDETILIAAGHNDSTQTSVAQAPSHLGIQYSYIHGSDNSGGTTATAVRNGILLACSSCWFQGNYTDQLRSQGFESHVIFTDNGPGPIKIVHNWLEGGSTTIFVSGGASEAITGLVTSDIEIRGNRLTRDMAYCPVTAGNPGGSSGNNIKTGIETKSSQRVVFEGNRVENVCADGQAGFLMLLNVRACSSGTTCTNASHHVTQDWQVKHNLFNSGVSWLQYDLRSDATGAGQGVARMGRRISTRNNLVWNLGDHSVFGGSGSVLIFQNSSGGNTFTGNVVRNSAGTQSTITLTAINVGAELKSGMQTGDLIFVGGCTDTSFCTSTTCTAGSATSIGPAAISADPDSVTVVYPNPGTPNASTVCTTIKNIQGTPDGLLLDHNTVACTGNCLLSSSAGSAAAAFTFHRSNRITNNIFTLTGTLGGFKEAGLAEGTASEATYELGTFEFHHSVITKRPSSNYTEYPSGLLCSDANATCWFPSAIECSGSTADASCVGYSGFMSGVPYNINPADYHDFNLHSTSLYKTTRKASDGTPLGADISLIDSKLDATQYVCDGPCGAGPFPD
jgi:hypothetical protein